MVEAFSKFSYCKKLPTSRKLCFLRLNGISWVRKVPSTVMVPNKLWSLFSKSGFANPWPLQNQIFVCRKTLAFISTPKERKRKESDGKYLIISMGSISLCSSESDVFRPCLYNHPLFILIIDSMGNTSLCSTESDIFPPCL